MSKHSRSQTLVAFDIPHIVSRLVRNDAKEGWFCKVLDDIKLPILCVNCRQTLDTFWVSSFGTCMAGQQSHVEAAIPVSS